LKYFINRDRQDEQDKTRLFLIFHPVYPCSNDAFDRAGVSHPEARVDTGCTSTQNLVLQYLRQKLFLRKNGCNYP
jgi:hypothetical protein